MKLLEVFNLKKFILKLKSKNAAISQLEIERILKRVFEWQLSKPNYTQKITNFNLHTIELSKPLNTMQINGLNNAISSIIILKSPPKFKIYSRQIRKSCFVGDMKNLSGGDISRILLRYQLYVAVITHSEKLKWQKDLDGAYLIPIPEIKSPDQLKRLKHVCCMMPKPKKEKCRVIFETGKCEISRPVEKLLEQSREYVKTGSSGQIIIGPKLTTLYRTLEKILKKYIVYDFDEMLFPKTTSIDLLNKLGHLRSLGAEYLAVSEFKSRKTSDMSAIFNDWYISGKAKNIGVHLKQPRSILTYAQCIPFWGFVANTKTDGFTVYDVSGPSYRNEGNGVSGIERLSEFRRQEIVYCATEKNFEKLHNKLYQRYIKLFNLFGVKYRVLMVPSWSDMASSKAYTYDFEIWIPQKNKWLEIGNLSNNGTTYPRVYNVVSNSEQILIAGCSGIGLDRLALATMSYSQNLDLTILKLKKLLK